MDEAALLLHQSFPGWNSSNKYVFHICRFISMAVSGMLLYTCTADQFIKKEDKEFVAPAPDILHFKKAK